MFRDLGAMRADVLESGSLAAALACGSRRAVLDGAIAFFGYLLTMLLISFVVGQMAAICLFIAVYLWRWGGYGWRVSLVYALGGLAILYGFYDQVMGIFWMPSLLDGLYSRLFWFASLCPGMDSAVVA
jgi:hypothetical protein